MSEFIQLSEEESIEIQSIIEQMEEGSYILNGKRIYEYERERSFSVEVIEGDVYIFGLGCWFNADGSIHGGFRDYRSQIYKNGNPCYESYGGTWYCYDGENVFATVESALIYAEANYPQFEWKRLWALPPSAIELKTENDIMPF